MDDLERDYSSSDDSDYVPEAAVSDSDSGGEDQGGNDETNKGKGKGKKIKKDSQLKRKRKGGIKLEGEDDVDEKCLDEEQEQNELEEERKALEEEEKKARAVEEEEKEKKRADDLWKSLLSDVGPRPKATSAATPVNKVSSSVVPTGKQETAEEAAPGDAATSSQKMVSVTKVFDFAGEEVTVTKEVKVDSKEAEMEIKQPDQATKPSTGPLPLGGKRKPGGIGSVLGKLNKKPKISVLEKSKLDWDSFKKKAGITEDLRIHNKGKEGFLQKQDFLKEADLRQYEIERKMRMGQSGR